MLPLGHRRWAWAWAWAFGTRTAQFPGHKFLAVVLRLWQAAAAAEPRVQPAPRSLSLAGQPSQSHDGALGRRGSAANQGAKASSGAPAHAAGRRKLSLPGRRRRRSRPLTASRPAIARHRRLDVPRPRDSSSLPDHQPSAPPPASSGPPPLSRTAPCRRRRRRPRGQLQEKERRESSQVQLPLTRAAHPGAVRGASAWLASPGPPPRRLGKTGGAPGGVSGGLELLLLRSEGPTTTTTSSSCPGTERPHVALSRFVSSPFHTPLCSPR